MGIVAVVVVIAVVAQAKTALLNGLDREILEEFNRQGRGLSASLILICLTGIACTWREAPTSLRGK